MGAASERTFQESSAREESYPRLLDDHLRETLSVLAEELLPGSRAAGVAELLDRVMAVEPIEEQRRFLSALGAFEREARERYAKPWLELDRSQRIEILSAASTLAPQRPRASTWTRGQPVELEEPGPTPPSNLRDHFDRLRAWVARAYATTEVGMKDLGFNGKMAWANFPGCPHPDDEHR